MSRVSDTHGEPSRFSTKNFQGTKDDIIIVAGDFGFIWTGDKKDDYWLDALAQKPFTICFVDGNHENFNALANYPIVLWNGGLTHKIRENIFHLMRGEIFSIDGNSIFVMGGGTSIDKSHRKENISWWSQEEPNFAEIENGFEHLEAVGNSVDYVIAHELPQEIMRQFDGDWETYGHTRKMLDEFNNIIQFKKWYCGHYHADTDIGKYSILYDRIVALGE